MKEQVCWSAPTQTPESILQTYCFTTPKGPGVCTLTNTQQGALKGGMNNLGRDCASLISRSSNTHDLEVSVSLPKRGFNTQLCAQSNDVDVPIPVTGAMIDT